jgi:hypothetical protein
MTSVGWSRSVLVVTALLLLGCGGGGFTESGYVHSSGLLSVKYRDPSAFRFVSSDWQIDNHVTDEQGRPTYPKEGDDWKVVFDHDISGDGSRERFSWPRFELKLSHRANDAAIWIRTIPLAKSDETMELRVFAERYVDALSGTGFYGVDRFIGATKVTSIQFAAKFLDRRARTLGGQEAFEATIEVANIDQLKLDPTSRHSKIRIVVARTDRKEMYAGGGKYVTAKLLVVAGYRSRPADFDAGLKDFETFLGSVALNRR